MGEPRGDAGPLRGGDIAFPERDAYVKEEAMEEARPEVAMEEATGWNPILVGRSWMWTEIVSCMPEVDVVQWSPSPPREEVVQAPSQPTQQSWLRQPT
ncbi:putative histone-lysine N-methyltransferase ATXR3 [Hordeum vulgare]|nr:putative histone-lysine N-methyltransferase ATXR3 [Hordeum vulgare]